MQDIVRGFSNCYKVFLNTARMSRDLIIEYKKLSWCC